MDGKLLPLAHRETRQGYPRIAASCGITRMNKLISYFSTSAKAVPLIQFGEHLKQGATSREASPGSYGRNNYC
jgi:hypothetical protein